MCVLLTKSAGAFPLQLGFYQLTLTWAWQFKPHTAHFNKSPPWLELIKLHEQTPPLPPP